MRTKVIGRVYWFEYHCLESPGSHDAQLWYRSHRKVEVRKQLETDEGEPKVYEVKFEDGWIGDVFEDELYVSKRNFNRPDPPKDAVLLPYKGK